MRHVRAILLLPFMVTLVVPALLVRDLHVTIPGAVAGATLIAAGLWLFVGTVRLLARVGRGTLAPWDPTSRLVGLGPYERVRNPMITGVFAILLGEAALLGSWAVLAWAGVFALANALWIPLVEEPGLLRRFGSDYEAYRANVPRWLPRLRGRPSG
jgi:protein-S-isoprenylcysteine O-methyltransferase Ste14